MRVEQNESDQAERPFAYADPRSLSQAWYDALYGAKPRSNAAHARTGDAQKFRDADANDAPVAGDAETQSFDTETSAALLAEHRAQTSRAANVSMTSESERVRRDATTRAGAPRPTAPHAADARNDVEIRDADGNEIRLLLSQHGERVDVVAVSDPEAAGRVAEALERARVALGARGIGVTARVEERGER